MNRLCCRRFVRLCRTGRRRGGNPRNESPWSVSGCAPRVLSMARSASLPLVLDRAQLSRGAVHDRIHILVPVFGTERSRKLYRLVQDHPERHIDLVHQFVKSDPEHRMFDRIEKTRVAIGEFSDSQIEISALFGGAEHELLEVLGIEAFYLLPAKKLVANVLYWLVLYLPLIQGLHSAFARLLAAANHFAASGACTHVSCQARAAGSPFRRR